MLIELLRQKFHFHVHEIINRMFFQIINSHHFQLQYAVAYNATNANQLITQSINLICSNSKIRVESESFKSV